MRRPVPLVASLTSPVRPHRREKLRPILNHRASRGFVNERESFAFIGVRRPGGRASMDRERNGAGRDVVGVPARDDQVMLPHRPSQTRGGIE